MAEPGHEPEIKFPQRKINHSMTIQKTFTRKTIADHKHNFKMAFIAGWDIVTIALLTTSRNTGWNAALNF